MALPFSVNDNSSVTSAPGWGATAIWNSSVVGSNTSTCNWAPTSRLMGSPRLSGQMSGGRRGKRIVSAHHYPDEPPPKQSTGPEHVDVMATSLGDDRVDVSTVDADRRPSGRRRLRRAQISD